MTGLRQTLSIEKIHIDNTVPMAYRVAICWGIERGMFLVL